MSVYGRFRGFRARRRYMRPPVTSRAATALAITSLLTGAVILVSVLEGRAAVRERRMTEYARSRSADPFTLLAESMRNRPYLLLGDIAGAPAPKQFAARVIQALANGPGLDFVALEVGSDMQPWIDRYFEGDREDASVLVTHPRAIRQAHGAGNDYLAVYHAIWSVNRELGANRRIRVLAIDSPDWPPERATSPARLMPPFAARDDAMFRIISQRVLERDSGARILFFVDGLRTLRTPMFVEAGGSASARVVPLAAQIESAYPGKVVSVLVDALIGAGGTAPAIGYRPGHLYRVLRRTGDAGRPLAFRLVPSFGGQLDDLDTMSPPGLTIGFDSEDVRLASAIDVYVRLSN